ncbi:hypothetical protein B0J13DRAFT_297199 [Dactylonectria estremocensis]|uniref:Zn(2)-C6 fungal-type domain-containing protein n=1 Tax=Dactylonectria estremocensis TaxID=1079267 RepID=A0A9P9J413_9HYPO|nr:hypothetical protein B0J13DRAFT_297199 [Dactylonectria estremocensis]
MPPKRPYVPKTKGCHECSQRRIHCDRAEPQCKKCTQKGLKCSGLGIRHRFNNGVAARGKWVGKTMEKVYREKQEKLNGDAGVTPRRSPCAAQKPMTESLQTAPSDNTGLDPPKEALNMFTASGPMFQSDNVKESMSEAADEGIFPSTDIVLFQPVPDTISREQHHLLLHFSQHIAIEMSAFDGVHNGWRHLILPLAHRDELVMSAVLATAIAHQGLEQLFKNRLHNNLNTLWHPRSSRMYARTIRGLRERQELVHSDLSSKHSILVTILVLLSAMMVTACSDFPVIFRMLESAVDAMGGKQGLGEGELPEFIMRQVHKMRVYAAPLLCEQTGMEIISSQRQTAQLLDCLNYTTQQSPEQAMVLSSVSDMVEQACDIYLHHAFIDPKCASSPDTVEGMDSIRRVQRFKECLEAFPPGSPVNSVIIWATFVAALDCQLEEHKVYFEGALMQQFARNGFGNVLKGLEQVRQIWKRGAEERWTSMLPHGKVFVM